MKNGILNNVVSIISAGSLTALILLLATACSTPAGNPQDGKRWYSMHNCFACHGEKGNDGEAPNIKNLDMSYYRFEKKIRDAGSPIMPKYPEEKISSQDVADLYAFLKK